MDCVRCPHKNRDGAAPSLVDQDDDPEHPLLLQTEDAVHWYGCHADVVRTMVSEVPA